MLETLRIRGLLGGREHVMHIQADRPVVQAARAMEQHNVGCLIVVDGDGQVVGILSERDVVMKVVASQRDLHATLVSEVMTRSIVSCTRATPIAEAQRLMAQHDIRHLPIVEDGTPVGMLSSRDILAHQLSTVEQIARTQSQLLERLERTFPGIAELRRMPIEED